ncbi:MAG: DUF1449 family protein [Sphingomonadaceae bacterium]|nr:DUF1449 family protein [Sphingomonadaceae bacterium]
MFAIFLTPDYAIFSGAFLVMVGIGLIEAIGLGLGNFDLGADLDSDASAGEISAPSALDWLGLKHGLPILIWFTSLLGCLTIAGVAIQQIAEALMGASFHWGIASALALVVGGGMNRFTAGWLAQILPEYESSIIDTEDLVMRRGTVLEGSARRGHPARAKVIDQYGQAHYVMVEPHNEADIIGPGETALLVRRTGSLFFAQPEANTDFRPI